MEEVVVEEASKPEAYVRYLRARTAMSVTPLVEFNPLFLSAIAWRYAHPPVPDVLQCRGQADDVHTSTVGEIARMRGITLATTLRLTSVTLV